MKKQLTKTAKWRIAAICLLFLLWGIGGFAQQVSVFNQTADYSTKQVSFTVSWTLQPDNNPIWVIIDYIKVEGATTVGGWSRALVTGATATGDGSAATVAGQLGFWLNITATGGSANFTTTLSLAAGVEKFNWCAYALDTPPKATIIPAGGYNLYGTPPFTVNGKTLGDNVKTFGAGTCITSLSDATSNPTAIIPGPPAITLASGSTAQTVTAGSAITQIKYNTTNANGATHTNLPEGVSDAWAQNVYTISGTPTAAGTFNYTVATTNSNGCTNASASGTITVKVPYTGCNPSTLTLTGVGFANSNTYSRNGITLSAPVTVTTCQKTTYASGSSDPYNAACRSNPNYDGDLFSWCMVVQHASQLCPSPWRVPTRNDFCNYAGLGDECTSTTSSIKSGMDGWLLGGYCNNQGGFNSQNYTGYYWAATALTTTNAYNTGVTSHSFSPSMNTAYSVGFTLRCVR